MEKRHVNKRKLVNNIILHVVLIIIALATITPFLWTLSTSLKGQNEAVFSIPPKFIPENATFENYAVVWNTLPIPRYFINSVILAAFGVILPVILCSMAAFPLARMEFKGKQAVFLTIMATMMIPGEVTMIPTYLIINKVGLMGNYAGIILPAAVSAFGIFLMRQAFLGIPKEIEESALIDGASVWRIWSSILMPMVKPNIATLSILSFIGAWNNFLWPLLVLKDPNTYPLTLGLYKLQGTFVANTRLIASGAMIALVPILIVFLFFQRYFIEAAYSSAVKG
ncbi:MAG: carbohydrate ABC transporter permease [Xylanivirga thermophila]|jgi:putative chitobiose transport system permease protein|uniref:carbohydrate ABC transporter permease n=1 Tax=Xylanivirga thermophila TaxID=2496273 RepID=UPI0039F4F79B